jgi:hypothetical protein
LLWEFIILNPRVAKSFINERCILFRNTASGDAGFAFLSNTKVVLLPLGLSYIGSSAFALNKDLEFVEIPMSVGYIGKRKIPLFMT